MLAFTAPEEVLILLPIRHKTRGAMLDKYGEDLLHVQRSFVGGALIINAHEAERQC